MDVDKICETEWETIREQFVRLHDSIKDHDKKIVPYNGRRKLGGRQKQILEILSGGKQMRVKDVLRELTHSSKKKSFVGLWKRGVVIVAEYHHQQTFIDR